MPQIVPIRRAPSPDGDIIFVHGLGGDAHTTWGFDKNPSWHTWIAANRPDLNIWSIEYQVEPSEWTGGAMPLSDRALNILALLDNRSIGTRPIIFIGHSMGGLLIKEMLRHALTVTTKFRHIVDSTKAIILFATPNTGASLADIATFFGFILRDSVAVSELKAQQPRLRDLNLWFRNNYSALNLKSCIFFETQKTAGVRVVNETSADPGIALVWPIPIDANHITIVKPDSYDSIVVGQTLKTSDEAIPSKTHAYNPDRLFENGAQLPKVYQRRTDHTWNILGGRIRAALLSGSRPLIASAIVLVSILAAATWYFPNLCSSMLPISFCIARITTPSIFSVGEPISVSQNIGDPLFLFGFQTTRMTPLKIIFVTTSLKPPVGSAVSLFPVLVQRNNQPFQNQYLQGISLDAEPAGSNFVIMFADDQFKKWATMSDITQRFGANWLLGCSQPSRLDDNIVQILEAYFEHAFVWSPGSYTATIECKINSDETRHIYRTFNLSEDSLAQLRAMKTKLKRYGGLMLDPSQIGNLSYTDVTATNFISTAATITYDK